MAGQEVTAPITTVRRVVDLPASSEVLVSEKGQADRLRRSRTCFLQCHSAHPVATAPIMIQPSSSPTTWGRTVR